MVERILEWLDACRGLRSVRLRYFNACGANNAAGLGAVYGGASVCAWYPITPSSSVAESFQKHCSKFRVDPETGKNRYAIVQAEDELASIGMVIGAGWNGARAFTSTSGPGISILIKVMGVVSLLIAPLLT